MNNHSDMNGRLIESLYCEALVLSDEVRASFDLSRRLADAGDTRQGDEDQLQVALSCEALRTTTRMMHAIAWLLNHRAYHAGEISEFRLRIHGRLPTDFAAADRARVALLPAPVAELIAETEDFYARLLRIDHRMRAPANEQHPGIDLIRERMGLAA